MSERGTGGLKRAERGMGAGDNNGVKQRNERRKGHRGRSGRGDGGWVCDAPCPSPTPPPVPNENETPTLTAQKRRGRIPFFGAATTSQLTTRFESKHKLFLGFDAQDGADLVRRLVDQLRQRNHVPGLRACLTPAAVRFAVALKIGHDAHFNTARIAHPAKGGVPLLGCHDLQGGCDGGDP